jgi:HEAT repeat protein
MKRIPLFLTLALLSFVGVSLFAQDLDSTDAKVRQKAVKALASDGGDHSQACESLGRLVNDPSPDVRGEVVIALIKVGGQQCLAPLRAATKDADPDIQSAAVDGLVNFYIPGYVKFGWLNSAKAFGGQVTKRFKEPEPLMIEPSVKVMEADVAAIAPLVTGGSSMSSRANAARAIGILRGASAMPQLTQALTANDKTVVIESLQALEKIGDRSAGPAVVPVLKSTDAAVREVAAHAAGQLQAKDGVADLARLAQGDSSKPVRRAALVALAKIPENGEERTFLMFLRDKDEQMRAAAAEGMGRGGQASDLSTINDAFAREKKESARLSMAFGAVLLGDLNKTTYLVDGLDSTLHRGEARAFLIELARIPRVLAELYTPLTSGTRGQKMELARVVASSGTRESVPHLERLTNDADTRVAQAAIRELKNLQARL